MYDRIHVEILAKPQVETDYGFQLKTYAQAIIMKAIIETSEGKEIISYFNPTDFLIGVSAKLQNQYGNYKSHEMYVISCDCGISECIGLYDGANIKEYKDGIVWSFKHNKVYKKFLKKNEYVFQKEQYIAEIKKVFILLDELLLTGEYYLVQDVMLVDYLNNLDIYKAGLFYRMIKSDKDEIKFLYEKDKYHATAHQPYRGYHKESFKQAFVKNTGKYYELSHKK